MKILVRHCSFDIPDMIPGKFKILTVSTYCFLKNSNNISELWHKDCVSLKHLLFIQYSPRLISFLTRFIPLVSFYTYRRNIGLKTCRNCAFTQNFHTKKLGEILVFYAVFLNSIIRPCIYWLIWFVYLFIYFSFL